METLSTQVSNVACPGCGCVCDDLTLTLEAGRLRDVAGACELGDGWFRKHATAAQSSAMVEGRPADFSTAVARAVDVLQRANRTLVYGLARTAVEGQRAAVALTESIGGVLDTTASMCHGPSIMALQEVGEVA